MRMHIVDGVIHIEDLGEDTQVMIHPRRSATHGMTRVELRGAALEPLDLIFEHHHDPVLAERWLWRGDTSSALRVAHAVMREIDDELERQARSPNSRAGLKQQWCDLLRSRFPATALEPDPH